MSETGELITYCPLFSIGTKEGAYCQEEECAWWLKNLKVCAITDIATSLEAGFEKEIIRSGKPGLVKVPTK